MTHAATMTPASAPGYFATNPSATAAHAERSHTQRGLSMYCMHAYTTMSPASTSGTSGVA